VDVRGSESLGVSKGRVVHIGFDHLSHLDHELDGLGLHVTFAYASKGGRPAPTVTPMQAGLSERRTLSVILMATRGMRPAVSGTSEA
jgi:hypothetical protein